MEYRRAQFSDVYNRLNESRKFIQVIAGPRQVGKSTLMDQVLSNCPIPQYLFNADGIDENDSDWIRRVWESTRSQMDIKNQTEAVMVIDEIQKIKQWSEIVKREWDADTRARRNLKIFLLGSSRLMLRKGLKESLAGRFEIIRLALERTGNAGCFWLDIGRMGLFWRIPGNGRPSQGHATLEKVCERLACGTCY